MRKLQTLVLGVALAAASQAAFAATITPEQRARLAERLQLVDQIVRVVDADLRASANAAEQRRWLQEALYAMPLEKLRTLGVPPTFGAASDAIVRADKTTLKSIGDASTDLVYRPITPCRYIDTRNVGGPITTPRSFDLGLTGGSYGGAAGCNPVAASGVGSVDEIAAVSVNVAIVSPTAQPGFLGVRPAGSANTTAFVNWYLAGPTIQASNSGVVTTAQGAGDDIEFFGSPTQVVVDVMGVFSRPEATALQCVTTVTNGGPGTVADGTEYQFFIPDVGACPSGYTRVAVACEYGPISVQGLALITVGAPDDTTGFTTCTWRNGSGGPLNQASFHTHQRCCRIPGR